MGAGLTPHWGRAVPPPLVTPGVGVGGVEGGGDAGDGDSQLWALAAGLGGHAWEEEDEEDEEWCVFVACISCALLYVFLHVSRKGAIALSYIHASGAPRDPATHPQKHLTKTNRDDLNISRHGSVLPGRMVFSMSRPQIAADEAALDRSLHSSRHCGHGGLDRSLHSQHSAQSAPAFPRGGASSGRSTPVGGGGGGPQQHLRPGSAPPVWPQGQEQG